MAQNKIDSRKLYQKILSNKGKINLFTEYVQYYGELLNKKTADKRQAIIQKHEAEIAQYDFYLKPVEEVYATFEKTDIKEKEKELNLLYRKTREENKRLIAKNPEAEAELTAATEAAKNDCELELKAYKEGVRADIEAARADANLEEIAAKKNEVLAKHEAELATFDEKQKASNEKKFAHNEAKQNKRVEKLKTKLAVLEEQLAVINELESQNTILQEGEVLRVQDLCMYFGGLHAVDMLNFNVKEGEIFGLIGPNGAGKTTVFNCITQFYKPTAGEIAFRSKEGDIIDLKKEKVHNVVTLGIARTFQNVEVIRECTVLENMLIAANRQYQSNLFDHIIHDNMLKLEEAVITQRAMKVLDFMGLTAYANHLAMGLPYGILKKIEIARTLMTNPQLIILDEPAAGLNDSETKDLAKLIRRICDEYHCTILLVEHDMGLVMSICDRICAIAFGKLLCLGTPAEIQANKAVQEAYLGASDE